MYYDKKDPINKGVQEFQIIGCASGVMMHRVVYKCTISGNSYTFVTGLRNIPPGLIAYPIFTESDGTLKRSLMRYYLKRKLGRHQIQQKKMQAQFVCIAHNLMMILENCIEKEG